MLKIFISFVVASVALIAGPVLTGPTLTQGAGGRLSGVTFKRWLEVIKLVRLQSNRC
jgi:hypothetical protein